jgi:hypothetical protein
MSPALTILTILGMLSIVSGGVLSLSVPFLVPLLFRFGL